MPRAGAVIRLAALLIGMIAIWSGAEAQGLTISPILIEAPEQGGATSLTVASASSESTLLQVRVFKWTQENGQDVLTPSENVTFSPEIFELRVGERQIVRMLTPARDPGSAWRVYINELPKPVARRQDTQSALDVKLEYILPMFVGGLAQPGEIEVELAGGDAGSARLAFRNHGDLPVRLHTLSMSGAEDDRSEFFRPALVYVLPGSVRHVDIVDPVGAPHTISYSIGQERYEQAVE